MTGFFAADPYWDAHKTLKSMITAGPGADFGLEDIATEQGWEAILASGLGFVLVGGALSGALEGLRERKATSADVLSCPIVPIGGSVTPDDMRQAVDFLATGLTHEQNHEDEQEHVTDVLNNAGDLTNSRRITSLVLAIAAVAGHAADHGRV